MNFWSFYFLVKLVLFFAGQIEFHWMWNVALLAVVIWPLSGLWKWLRFAICLPAGLLLLYHDSFLPPIPRVLEAWAELSEFAWYYQLELIGRLFVWQDMFYLLLAGVIFWLLSLKLRMATFAVLGVLAVPLVGYLQSLNSPAAAVTGGLVESPVQAAVLTPDAQLEQFYLSEAKRRTVFPKLMPEELSFDLVILHVCSLAWDDLELLNASKHPVFSQFDAVFTEFNSAASYSGPAAIRLLRSSCGAQPHADLYHPATNNCLLLPQLERLGFEPALLLNHDGVFGDFLQHIRQYGQTRAPLLKPSPDAPAALRQFDGKPMFRDADVLRHWLELGAEAQSPRLLYYNTTTLHDGNRIADRPKLSSDDSFPLRMDMLLGDLGDFLKGLEQRQRPTIVLLLPEHGAALRGDDWQVSGLREVPTPSITNVPFALRLVGRETAGPAQTISAPISYLAVSELISRFVLNDPFGPAALELEDYIQDLPQTAFVAENEGIVVMDDGQRFVLRGADGRWSTLTTGLRVE